MGDVTVVRRYVYDVASNTVIATPRHYFRYIPTVDDQPRYLSPRYRMWLAEYSVDADIDRARRALGYGYSLRAMEQRNMLPALQVKLDEHEADCALRAKYVREYIRDVLEFCPTDYFTVALDGGWVIQQDKLEELPHNYKRLIESVEVDRQGWVKVRFISKAAALAMAARYTLTQKFEAVTTPVPWDELALPEDEGRAIEERIRAVQRVQGPVPAEAASVAEGDVLRQASSSGPVSMGQRRNGSDGRKHAG